MLELLRELVMVHGVTGYEAPIREAIEAKLPDGVEKTVDNLGNLIATIGSGPGGIIFAAHMDELGMVVADIRDDGFLKVKSLGGIDPRVMAGRVLRILTSKGEVKGVIGVKPPHLMYGDRSEMKEVVPFEKMYLDIGADSAEEARGMGVDILDPVTFDKTFEVLNGKYISARGLDDRAGCAIQILALRELDGQKLAKKVHFAFTVQEERGLRGAQLVGHSFEAQYAFAIDTASSGCEPSTDRSMGPAIVGGGPTLRAIDNRHISDPAFVREIKALAESKGIPVQVAFTGGGTDAAAIEVQGPKALPIAFPARYTHSPVELASLEDFENAVKLVVAIVEEYAA
jgi:putative aminopeptidase FrvX